MADYAESLLILKEWVRRYSDAMRNHHYDDAQYAAIQIAKASLICLQSAKELSQAQFPPPTDIQEE